MLEEDAREGEGSSEEETDGGPQAKAWVGDVAEAAGGGILGCATALIFVVRVWRRGGRGATEGGGGGTSRNEKLSRPAREVRGARQDIPSLHSCIFSQVTKLQSSQEDILIYHDNDM